MIKKEYDIVVVGAGSAGVAAAVSASSKNVSVLLVEKSNRIGGMATKSEVGTICGLYRNDTSTDFTFNVDGFTEKFARNIQKESNSSPVLNSSGLKFLPYSIAAFEKYCTKILQENNIDVCTDTILSEVSVNGHLIESVHLRGIKENSEVKIKAIIDASGNNVVSELAGEKLKSISFQQTFTQIFRLSNLNFKSEQNLAFILLLKTKDKGNISVVPGSYSKNSVALKLNLSEEMTKPALRKYTEEAVHFLKTTINGFLNAELISIADEVGLRLGNRAEGEYTLTENDVLTCRKFENSIANGNWPVELWKANEDLEIKQLIENDFYQIPVTCLLSKRFKNLFFAGRNISADENAIASARVIGTCLQTGYEAGRLAKKIFHFKAFLEAVNGEFLVF